MLNTTLEEFVLGMWRVRMHVEDKYSDDEIKEGFSHLKTIFHSNMKTSHNDSGVGRRLFPEMFFGDDLIRL
jgi:hypothetical protein